MSESPKIQMTPDKIERLLRIIVLTNTFNDDPIRAKILLARILARALSNDELYALVELAATEPVPDQEDPEFQKAVTEVDGYIHSIFEVQEGD